PWPHGRSTGSSRTGHGCAPRRRSRPATPASRSAADRADTTAPALNPGTVSLPWTALTERPVPNPQSGWQGHRPTKDLTKEDSPSAYRATTPRWHYAPPQSGRYAAIMSVTSMTLCVPDDLAPAIRAAAGEAGLSVNAYVVRAARRAATLDAAKQLAALGLADTLAGEGDTL